MPDEKTPQAVLDLAQAGGVEAPIWVLLDLDADGRFGEEWLAAGREGFAVYAKAGTGWRERRRARLDDLKAVRAGKVVGGGSLLVETAGGLEEVARCSNSRERDLGHAAAYLSEVLAWRARKAKGEDPGPEPRPPADTEPPKSCPRCGLPLEKDSTVCPACFDKGRTLLRLAGMVRPHWRHGALVSLLILLMMLANLVPPWLTKPLVDDVLSPSAARPLPERATLLGWLVLAFLASRAAIQVMGVLQGRAMVVLGARLSADLRAQVFGKVQTQSLRFFHRYNTGAIMSRITQDTETLEHALVDVAPWFAVNLLTLLGIGCVLAWMDWRLTLLLLIPVPVVLAFSTLFWRRLLRILTRFFQARAAVQEYLNDRLSGIRVVKAFAQEEREAGLFRRHNLHLYGTTVAFEQVWSTFFPVLAFLIGLGEIIVWFAGGRRVLAGEMTLGTLLLFAAYLGMFYGPLQFFSRVADFLSRSLASAGRVFEVMDAEVDVREARDPVALPRIEGRIELRKVTFGYDAHKPVLHGVDLDIRPGEMIGFVGKSGAGKSTLVNLVCRFYDPQEGAVLVDGQDLRRVREHDLRAQFGVVLQDTFLFSGSILDNIRYAKPGAGFEEVLAASRAANAHDFIVKKPDGYDTRVGERGQALSGGERQRIAIARAILHDPRVLILDEATASVDTDTERLIQEAIARLVKGRTTLAIAHRLSTLRGADRLVVIKDGRVAETGSHDELLARQGEFHRLVQMQQEMARITAVHR